MIRAPSVGLVIAIIALSHEAAAQRVESDSLAATARAHYREGAKLAEAKMLASALEHIKLAHQAWPAQPAYPIAAARLAAQLGDTTGAVAWLAVVADLGIAVDLDVRPDLVALSKAAQAASVIARLRANAAPLRRSTAIRTSLPNDFYPEGIDYDRIGRRWLVAGVRQRTIAAVDSTGHATPFLASSSDRLDAVLGVRVDAARNLVWATTRPLPQQAGHIREAIAAAGVLVIDRPTGRLLAKASAPNDSQPHWFGDLTVGPDGTAYLSDSESPVIYRASYGSGRVELEEFVRHRYFRSLQGLALDPATNRLYAADYAHGILAIDLGDRSVRHLASPPRDHGARHRRPLVARRATDCHPERCHPASHHRDSTLSRR